MPVTATITLTRPAFTLSDELQPAQFNAVALTSASVVVDGALASDGSTPATGTQAFQHLTASGTLTVTGAATLASLAATSATLGALAVTGATTLAGATINGNVTLPFPYTLTAHGGLFSSGTISTTGNISATSGMLTVQTVSAGGNISAGGSLSATGNLTAGGTSTLATLNATTLRVGAVNHNPLTQLAAKTLDLAVTLAAGASATYNVPVSASANGLTGALASTDWQGLVVTRVWSPVATGSGNVAVTVRNDTGGAMTSAGVRFSVLAFKAD